MRVVLDQTTGCWSVVDQNGIKHCFDSRTSQWKFLHPSHGWVFSATGMKSGTPTPAPQGSQEPAVPPFIGTSAQPQPAAAPQPAPQPAAAPATPQPQPAAAQPAPPARPWTVRRILGHAAVWATIFAGVLGSIWYLSNWNSTSNSQRGARIVEPARPDPNQRFSDLLQDMQQTQRGLLDELADLKRTPPAPAPDPAPVPAPAAPASDPAPVPASDAPSSEPFWKRFELVWRKCPSRVIESSVFRHTAERLNARSESDWQAYFEDCKAESRGMAERSYPPSTSPAVVAGGRRVNVIKWGCPPGATHESQCGYGR